MTVETPHPLELYRWAVQDPETHAVLLSAIYQRTRDGRRPLVLREDFAGTAADAVAWVARGSGRSAVAVEIDPATVAWASERAQRVLGERASSLRFAVSDVLEAQPPAVPVADIISALNYSPFYFHAWAGLVAYLRAARAGLSEGGVLIANLFGGERAVLPRVERMRITPSTRPGTRTGTEVPIEPFWYEWEVRAFDPRARRVDCRIHFHVDGGGAWPACSMADAFRYDWRVWSARELLAACREAGFAAATLWRHAIDPASPTGVFFGPVGPEALDRLPCWNAYIAACR